MKNPVTETAPEIKTEKIKTPETRILLKKIKKEVLFYAR